MQQYIAGIINPDRKLESELAKPGLLQFDLKHLDSIEQLNSAASKGTLDFVIFLETSDKPAFELLNEFRKATPNLPAVLIVKAASGAWEKVIGDSHTEIVSWPANSLEFQLRVSRLLSRIREAKRIAPISQALSTSIRELRNLKSGKLDATRIAKTFGLSEADIARSINKRPQTINATPDADSLQSLLLPYERIAAAVKYTAGELQPALKIWLQSPNPVMPGTTPAELVRKGHLEELASLWDDVMLGHPD